MALDPKIASLKAAGTYRFEFDKSQVVSIPANQTRLVVGFSKRGPFNTPVFIPDTAFFKQVYGDIDRNLERKDSFFHRSCLAALERGPILALNLLNLDADDKVNAVRFATSSTPEIQANAGLDYEYQKFYNRDKFWFPSTDYFLTNVGANQSTLSGATVNDFLDITNLGQTPISVIAKKSANTNVLAYNVTVEEWYGAANVPGFLNKDSLISDFFVDIFVIGGNFGGDFATSTPYSRFQADPTFQDYFDATQGLKRRIFAGDATDTQMANFFNLPEVELQATYTACLIPNFVDLLGNNLFVEKIVNADTATTGLFVTVNEDLFSGDILIDGVSGGIDMVGHNLEYQQATSFQDDINMLSYSGSIVSDLLYCRKPESGTLVENVSSTITVTAPTGGGVQIQVTDANKTDDVWTAFSTMTANTGSVVGSFIRTTGLAPANQYVPVISVQTVGTTVTVLLSDVGSIIPAYFPTGAGAAYNYINEVDIDFTSDEFPLANTTAGIIGSYGSTVATQFANGTLTDGDEAVFLPNGAGTTPTPQSFLVMNAVDYGFFHTGGPTTTANKIAISDSAYNLPSVRITPYQEDSFANLTLHADFTLDSTTGVFQTSANPTPVYAAANCLNVQTLKGALNLGIDIIGDILNEPTLKPNEILIATTSPEAADIIVGNYLVHDEGTVSGHSRLTRINSVVGGLTPTEYPIIPAGTTALLVTCQSEVDITYIGTQRKVELYYPIDKWIDYLNIFELPGFNLMATKHVPNGSNSRQNECLSPILGGTNLYKALTDKETINFRYVVDTYGNGVEANCKAVYTNLCAGRKNAFAIVNAPSAKDFKASTDPSFTDATGGLSSKFISEGGNLALNPTVRFSLPSATSGGSWGGYYYPFLTVRDLGRNISVPPAAYVSNNYILKYENALPWSIVAGVRRGVIGGNGVVGLELNLDQEDRYFLEPFGFNPIVFQSGTGPTIFANKTAQQVPKSALSSINVREVVIYIQDGIDAILKNYLFEFNTAQTRLEIKTLADNFLSTVQNDDGVYDYRNIMDETNNTPEVIDQNVGILDTYIEPVRGMEILVQRTTILRTGAISSGNFQ